MLVKVLVFRGSERQSIGLGIESHRRSLKIHCLLSEIHYLTFPDQPISLRMQTTFFKSLIDNFSRLKSIRARVATEKTENSLEEFLTRYNTGVWPRH